MHAQVHSLLVITAAITLPSKELSKMLEERAELFGFPCPFNALTAQQQQQVYDSLGGE
jgi:hypothetical protein